MGHNNATAIVIMTALLYPCEGSGVCILFALRSDIELILPIGQVSILLRAFASPEHRCCILLVSKSQSTLKSDAARLAAGCAEGKGHYPAAVTVTL